MVTIRFRTPAPGRSPFAGTARRGAAPPRRTHGRPRRTARKTGFAQGPARFAAPGGPRTADRLDRRRRIRRRTRRPSRTCAPTTCITSNSLALARFDAAQRGVDTTTKRKVYKKGWFMSDSMSLSKVCWISTVVPGYGQIYNKQYWKLPILYGLVGTGLGLYIHENKTYKPLKRQYRILYRREPLAHARAGRPPVQDDPQQHAASGLPGDHRSPRTSTSSATRP